MTGPHIPTRSHVIAVGLVILVILAILALALFVVIESAGIR